MKQKNIEIKYYLIIFLSVLDLLGIIIFGYLALMNQLGQSVSLSFSFKHSTAHANYNVDPVYTIMYATISIICLIIQGPLTVYRQKLRDEVEYDENGVSRKQGKFSQLSKQKRDEIEQAKMLDNERLLDTPTVKRITHSGSNNPDEDMKKLIGLNDIKRSMHELVARVIYEQEKRESKRNKNKDIKPVSSMHMCFLGAPGTGKTTLARIMTGFLYETGYIKKNQCVEIDGNFLSGLTPSDSTKKTKMLILKALGGVLFIDEAYALLNSGSEIIATIVKEMEDRRNEIVFIFAGYDNDMKKLIASNPGLESRIKRYFYFKDYSIEDLRSIFISMAGDEGFVVSAELVDEFTDRMIYEKKQPNFGNARAVRNLLDKIIDRHAVNLYDGIIEPDLKYKLTSDDMPTIDSHKHI